MLGLEPLDGAHWLLVVAVAVAYLVFVELDKWRLRVMAARR